MTALQPGKPKYVVEGETTADGRLMARGTLKKGLKIGDATHTEFEMAEPLAGDLFGAEQDVQGGGELNMQGAMIARTLRKLGTYTGPFTLRMLSGLKLGDLEMLQAANRELDALGNAD